MPGAPDRVSGTHRSEGSILFVLVAVPTVLLVPALAPKRRVQFSLMALVAVVIMGPWVVRNLTTFDEPIVLGTGFGWVLAYGDCDATYSGPLLGYWSDDCALKDYPPALEESGIHHRARKKATAYIEDHLGRVPVVVVARVARVFDVLRPTQNVDLNEFYERRGHVASWAVLGYWLYLPFAIAGLVVMRKRRVPIFPMIAIAVSVVVTVALSFGITRYRAPVDVVLPALAAVALGAWWSHARPDREPDPAAAPAPLEVA